MLAGGGIRKGYSGGGGGGGGGGGWFGWGFAPPTSPVVDWLVWVGGCWDKTQDKDVVLGTWP